MEKLKLAVIGVGKLGSQHARVVSESEDAELIYVVDIIKERAEEMASVYSAEPLMDYKLVKDVDGVIIATPTTSHYEIAAHFLEKGINVLVEKPVTSTYKEAEKLLKLAEAKNSVLLVGHVERFNPAVRRLLELRKKPEYIRAQRLSQFTGRSTDIDVVFDLMIHDLELIITIMDEEPKLHHAFGFSFITGKLDFATATLYFSNGIAEVTASRVYDKKVRRMDAYFPSGTYAKVDFAENTFAVFRPMNKWIEQEWIRSITKENLMSQLENFVKAIKGEAEKIDYSAIKALKLAEKISNRAGSSVKKS
ncbi:MAG: Gfo/Idh/MocA family oxidoreductase [Candidatus Aminicenantes bacterium]|nr:Gfo/Idh/MocA family oxidoreductase [Candidatus Aminicenantes bacterium]